MFLSNKRATLQTFNDPAHGLIGNGYLKSERVDDLQIVHFKTQKAWKLLRKRKLWQKKNDSKTNTIKCRRQSYKWWLEKHRWFPPSEDFMELPSLINMRGNSWIWPTLEFVYWRSQRFIRFCMYPSQLSADLPYFPVLVDQIWLTRQYPSWRSILTVLAVVCWYATGLGQEENADDRIFSIVYCDRGGLRFASFQMRL